METLTPQQAFNRVFNGNKNFMTPDIERFETTENYFIEISSGSDFLGQKMIGVTVITKELEKRNELSKNCQSEEEVREYIDSLEPVKEVKNDRFEIMRQVKENDAKDNRSPLDGSIHESY